MYHSHTYVCTDCEFRCTPSRVESYLSSFNDSLYYKSLDWLTHVGSEEDTYNSGRSAAQDVPSLSNSIALLQKESKERRKSICDSVSIGRPGSICQTNHQPRMPGASAYALNRWTHAAWSAFSLSRVES